MRVVADTNIIVSGLLWRGNPRRILEAARAGNITLFTTAVLLVELEDVLSREKFALRLASAGVTPHDLVLGYAALASVIEPAEIEPVIVADPDDDAVLACAIAARSEVVISGDSHLLDLKQYQGIRIIKAAELLAEIS
jgi:putative PIN family toxin of toxin-antitoxin system